MVGIRWKKENKVGSIDMGFNGEHLKKITKMSAKLKGIWFITMFN